MKIALIARKNTEQWGGDLVALHHIHEGLQEIGMESMISDAVEKCLDADFIFLSNTTMSLKEHVSLIQKYRKRFGIIAFHENFDHFYSPCCGFAHFIALCLEQKQGLAFFSIEQLLDNPHIIDLFPFKHSSYFEENHPILAEAELCIANSHTEAEALRKDNPSCRAQVIHWACPIANDYVHPDQEAFLRWTGLKKGEYVLQVGRMEKRKNQLGSLLAMRHLDMPLVFIAMQSVEPKYVKWVLDSIKRFRKAPTFIIDQCLHDRKDGVLRIIQMPNNQRLSQVMLISAYQNAGLCLHPAFCELPGYTCLEAAQLHIPVVASHGMTLKDYFTDPHTGQYTMDDRIAYCSPHHINEITEKIIQQFGKKIHRAFIHPMLQRTKADVGRELIEAIKMRKG